MRDGEDLVVVGSNGGRPQPPAWFLNLEADPKATVRDGRRTLRVVAETVSPDDRGELWSRLHQFYPGWSHYQTLTDRHLPVIRLHPQTSPAREAGPTS
jgi:deazaflavin-dependent oxidoreductase (nitroreductase family)